MKTINLFLIFIYIFGFLKVENPSAGQRSKNALSLKLFVDVVEVHTLNNKKKEGRGGFSSEK